MPDFHFKPESRLLSEAFVGENVDPVNDLGFDHRSLFKCHGFFQVFHFSNLGGEQVIMDHGMSLKAGVFHWGELVIDPGMSLKAIDKVSEEFFSLSVEEKVHNSSCLLSQTSLVDYGFLSNDLTPLTTKPNEGNLPERPNDSPTEETSPRESAATIQLPSQPNNNPTPLPTPPTTKPY